MAYFSSVTKSNPLPDTSQLPLFQRLSLRTIKGIAGGLLLITSLGFLLFWQPAYLQLQLLQKEKSYWQQVVRTDVSNSKTDTKVSTIPTMDQLPDIIEHRQFSL